MKNSYFLILFSCFLIVSCTLKNDSPNETGWEYDEVQNQIIPELSSEMNKNSCDEFVSYDSKTITEFRKCRMSFNHNLKCIIDTLEDGYLIYFLQDGKKQDYARIYDKNEQLISQRQYTKGVDYGWEEQYNAFGELTAKRRYFTSDNSNEIIEEEWIYDNGTFMDGEGFYVDAVIAGHEDDQTLRIWFEGEYYNLNSVEIKLQFERNGKKVDKLITKSDKPTLDIELDGISYFDVVKMEAQIELNSENKTVHRYFTLKDLSD